MHRRIVEYIARLEARIRVCEDRECEGWDTISNEVRKRTITTIKEDLEGIVEEVRKEHE